MTVFSFVLLMAEQRVSRTHHRCCYRISHNNHFSPVFHRVFYLVTSSCHATIGWSRSHCSPPHLGWSDLETIIWSPPSFSWIFSQNHDLSSFASWLIKFADTHDGQCRQYADHDWLLAKISQQIFAMAMIPFGSILIVIFLYFFFFSKTLDQCEWCVLWMVASSATGGTPAEIRIYLNPSK